MFTLGATIAVYNDRVRTVAKQLGAVVFGETKVFKYNTLPEKMKPADDLSSRRYIAKSIRENKIHKNGLIVEECKFLFLFILHHAIYFIIAFSFAVFIELIKEFHVNRRNSFGDMKKRNESKEKLTTPATSSSAIKNENRLSMMSDLSGTTFGESGSSANSCLRDGESSHVYIEPRLDLELLSKQRIAVVAKTKFLSTASSSSASKSNEHDEVLLAASRDELSMLMLNHSPDDEQRQNAGGWLFGQEDDEDVVQKVKRSLCEM